jgi:DNA invertase Pin-like site-specific DNA recombinase
VWFGYARVSTAEQAADDRTSLEEQDRIIRGAALAHGIGAYDLQIFTDAGVSGSIPLKDRPQGKRLLEAQKGDTIIASKLDRLFRNALDALIVYEDLKERGVDLVLFEYGFTPITSDNSLAKLFFGILTTFADFERTRIRERLLEGKRAKKAKGGHVGGEAPLGYRIVGAEREARLEIDPNEQEILRVVDTCDAQMTAYQVARVLNGKGFVCRSGKKFQVSQAKRLMERKYGTPVQPHAEPVRLAHG